MASNEQEAVWRAQRVFNDAQNRYNQVAKQQRSMPGSAHDLRRAEAVLSDARRDLASAQARLAAKS